MYYLQSTRQVNDRKTEVGKDQRGYEHCHLPPSRMTEVKRRLVVLGGRGLGTVVIIENLIFKDELKRTFGRLISSLNRTSRRNFVLLSGKEF